METTDVIKFSKDEIKSFVDKLTSSVNNGEVNPLELFSKIKAMEKAFDEIRANIISAAIQEHSKFGEKKIEAYGFTIEQGEVSTKYHYGNCGDSLWNELNEKIEWLTKEKKKREAVLKLGVKDNDESWLIHPATKESVTGLKFSLK